MLPRIFDLFAQADTLPRPVAPGGLNIGLTLVKGLVAMASATTAGTGFGVCGQATDYGSRSRRSCRQAGDRSGTIAAETRTHRR